MNSGLEDVVAAETVMSEVDGQAGLLTIRGVSLDELAEWTYEELMRSLLEGFFEALPDTDGLSIALGEARVAVFDDIVAQADQSLAKLGTVDAVRALMARIDDGNDLATALRLIAGPAVFTPAIARMKEGLAPVRPRADVLHAHDMLRMLSEKEPSAVQAQALNTYLVTVSDHGLNASTFAARVVASTDAGLASAVLAGISALKGPLHGGAPGPVLDMLDGIQEAGDAERWLEDALDRGERLMGFGHRVYRVRDPRADALKNALERLKVAGEVDHLRLSLAQRSEAAALAVLKRRKPDRALDTNVEFYTALLLEALRFPRDAFTCVFAAGRVGGWIGHAREQALTGRLIRPQSRYVGPKATMKAA